MCEPARSDLRHYQRRHHQIPPISGHRDDSRVLKGRHFSPRRGRMETAPQQHERMYRFRQSRKNTVRHLR